MKTYVFSDLALGTQAAIAVNISQSDVDSFMALSGDFSTVHIDDAYAESRGFRRRIVHGVLVGAYISRLIGMELPGKHGVLRSLVCQFRKPVYASTDLNFVGKVTRVVPALRLAQVTVEVSEAERGVLVSAQAETVLKQ
jgi:3-hydroxybutyryl-CoA dehydratase